MNASVAPVLTDLTDSELFCRYRDLDCQDSFSALYARYGGLPGYVKRKFNLDDATADDIVQQAWLNVAKYKNAKVIKFKSWLVRIVHNAANQHFEKKAIPQCSMDEIDELNEPEDHRAEPVDKRALESDLLDGLNLLLKTLPPDMHLAVSLVANGGRIYPAAQEAGVHTTSLCRTLAELKQYVI